MRIVLAPRSHRIDTAALARAEIGGDDARFELIEIDFVRRISGQGMRCMRASRARAARPMPPTCSLPTPIRPSHRAASRASLALMRERKLDLLSLLSTLTFKTWFERVVQLATTIELMRQYPLPLANAPPTGVHSRMVSSCCSRGPPMTTSAGTRRSRARCWRISRLHGASTSDNGSPACS
jgi:hypothetical protein